MRKLRCSKEKNDTTKIKYNFFVFDTETTCLEPMPKNLVFGVLYGYSFIYVFHSAKEFKAELEKPQYQNKYIFAHNAEFDLLATFGNIYKEVDNKAIFNNKFISAKYKKITFGDSMNIYPASVEKIGELIGLQKIDNEKVKKGQLTKENMTDEDITYCKRDCKIIFNALLKVFELTGAIKLTLPSLAMYDFRTRYLSEDLLFSDLVDEFYDSYYGGRTEAFQLGRCDASVFDVNSMYPFAMLTTVFPDIQHLHKVVMCDVRFLNYILPIYEGMAKVRVRHKDTYFGYLPVRMKVNDSEKLVFPVGEFDTTVNFNELRFAILSEAVEILKVYYIIYAAPMESPFKAFINDNFEKRKLAVNELEKSFYKLKMNALYGRFGMRMKLDTAYFDHIPFDIVTELQNGDKFYEIKTFNEQRSDCYLITENEKFKNSFFSIPAFSSYITSEARIILLKALLDNEKNNVVYCDTDSLFINGSFSGLLGDDLGIFKKEPKRITEINGLKDYKYEYNGETRAVIKGISRHSIKESEGVYRTQKYYKTKGALRQNKEAGESYFQIKELRHKYDKRQVLGDGSTKPLNLDNFKPLKKIKVIKNYDPSTVYEAILMFFVSGGKLKKSELIDHITGNKPKEIKSYKELISDEGIFIDSFNDKISELLKTDNIKNDFIEVLNKFHTIGQMKKELLKIKEYDSDSLINFNKKPEYDYPF